MSRLPRTTRGARSFGHENSAPLVAQNHPPSIDPYSVAAEAAEKERGREERAISRHENQPRNGRPLRKQFNIRAREKKEGGGKGMARGEHRDALGTNETCFNSRHVSRRVILSIVERKFFLRTRSSHRFLSFLPFLVYFILLSICWKGGEKGGCKIFGGIRGNDG